MIKTKNIMTTAIHTIQVGQTMKAAQILMLEKNIRHLPVMNNENFVVGIISDRDIQLAMTSKKLNEFQRSITLDETLLVDEFMSWPVYMVSADTTIRRVAEELLSQKVSALLIADSHENLTGIVTTDDLLQLFLKGAPILPETAIHKFTKGIFQHT